MSTIQKTRLALAQGSVAMTGATRAMKGTMQAFGSQRPKIFARWTS
ncbi:hypothetical protein [Streptomyces sp. Qhu_M48]